MITIKLDFMPGLKLKQLQHESDTWKRVLGFMSDENVHLKNRLSEILKTNDNKSLLVKAEGFQNNFVREDEVIRLLRNDIAVFDKLLVREIFEDGIVMNDLVKKLKLIRSNINKTEKGFNKLKLEFNNYLLEFTSSL
jgi:hypothetical protein